MSAGTLTLGHGQKLQLTAQGVRITGELSYDEWRDILAALQNVKSAYHCSLADLLRYGKERFSKDEVAEALTQAELDYNDLVKAESIGQLTLDFRERNPLSAEHYFVLSQHDATASKKWAAIAIAEGLSALELKRSIEANKVLRSSDIQSASGQSSGINTIQGAIFRFTQWEQSMGGRAKILCLPAAERRNLLDLIRPTLELAAALEQSLPADQ